MSSACTIYSVWQTDCAAHDALQNRDRTKLGPRLGRSFGRSRISGAPPASARAAMMKALVHALALRRIRDTGRVKSHIPSFNRKSLWKSFRRTQTSEAFQTRLRARRELDGTPADDAICPTR
jgi:hypothetical protein